jgi:hypothetical protein
VIDLITANETLSGHHVRAWTGVAVDEGVGLISIVEVSDDRGRPVCRFEEFLDAVIQRRDPTWPRSDGAAARLLQARALERARAAILVAGLSSLNGHRFDVSPGPP